MRTSFMIVVSLALGCGKDTAVQVTSEVKAADPKPAEAKPTPPVEAKQMPPAEAKCAVLTISISPDGLTLKRDTETKATKDTLEPALRGFSAKCIGTAAIVANDDVTYQDLIGTMDIAVKVGFVDVVVARNEAAARSTQPKVSPKFRPTADTGLTGTVDNAALKNAPVIVVTRTGVVLGAKGKSIDLDAAELGAEVKAWLEALPKSLDGLVILQADQSTKAKVINVIVQTAQDAGFNNLLFAIKNK